MGPGDGVSECRGGRGPSNSGRLHSWAVEHGAHTAGRSQGTLLGKMHREILEGDFGQSKPLALAF